MDAANRASDNRERVLILAPVGRDAATIAEILDRAGLEAEICPDLAALCRAIDEGDAGAAIIAEEGLGQDRRLLRDCLERQPPWSDLPIVLVLNAVAGAARKHWAIERFAEIGNAMLLERPLRTATLVTAFRAALRARRRQYQAREYLRRHAQGEERLRAQEATLRQLNESLEQRVLERTRELEQANRRLLEEIEERRRVEEALFKARKLEAIGQLTGGVAHDFNNLLSAVLGNLELLELRLGENEGAQRLVRNAARAAERGAKLTEQLLAFARKQHLRPEPIDVNRAVAGMSDLLARTLGGTIRLQTALQPDLWPALADPSQIELVILNLAINSRDAMPLGGSLVIETVNVPAESPERPADLDPGHFVRLAVTDTGTGMSDDVLARAFEPFFTTKEVGKGTGLGLAQVYGVVTQLGGDIRLRSRVGEGTTVEIYLPRAAAEPVSAPVRVPERATAAPSRAKILVVDDDPDVREVVANGLASAGYQVEVASDARVALDLIERADLLVADFAMPGMTGAELARAARERLPDLPIVIITGYAETKLGDLSGGADYVLKKPFKLGDLTNAIEATARRKPAPRARDTDKVVPLTPRERLS